MTAVTLLGITIFVFLQLSPKLIFSTHLPDGGDMGAHVYLPYYMKHYLLGQARLTGWSPGWYSGFPIFTFYFPLPSLMIALTSYVINYAIAFKLIVVLGLLMMPISAWAMAKLAGWDPPIPVAMAGATLPFLFERSFTIDGGNIASTMAGEYSFALSLSIGLILIGLVTRGLDTGKYRGISALLFAVVAMCHVLPAFFIGGICLVLLLTQLGKKRIWWALSAGAVGMAITAFWLLPFYVNLNYSTNMGWQKVTNYMTSLFPSSPTVESIPFGYIFVVAMIGGAISTARWIVEVRRKGWGAGGAHRLGFALLVMVGASAGIFILAPTSAVYNARALPFWFLANYLLVGVALGEIASFIGIGWRKSPIGRRAAWWWLGADFSISDEDDPAAVLSPSSMLGSSSAPLSVADSGALDEGLADSGALGGGFADSGSIQFHEGAGSIGLEDQSQFYESQTSTMMIKPGQLESSPSGSGSAGSGSGVSGDSDSELINTQETDQVGSRSPLESTSSKKKREFLAKYPKKPWKPAAILGSIILTLGMIYFVSLPLSFFSSFPGASAKTNESFVPGWVKWNFTGYQGQKAWPEYHSIMQTMARVGSKYGCGRAMWEYDPSENRFGTPMALMLLPYWTKGCVDSMEGLLFESSATTPYHFINQAELSDSPSEAMRNIPYAGMNVAEGIQHLQMLGVRYFIAFSPDVEQAALANPNLTLISRTGPWNGIYNGTSYSDTWDVFLIHNSAQVTPLRYAPVVMKGVGSSETDWLSASMAWYINPSAWNVELTANGPSSWKTTSVQKIDVSPTATQIPPPQINPVNYPATPLPAVSVSDIHESSDSISFRVSRIGVPVMVRTSYFPNWSATGAQGPYRAVPNMMIVVPTSKYVSLHYGYSSSDILGWLLTILGLVFVVIFWRRPALAVPSPAKSKQVRISGAEESLFQENSAGSLAAGEGSALPVRVDPSDLCALDVIFKAYDVRGTVPDQLDFDICKAIGVSYTIFLRLNGHLGKENRVIVCRDMRDSGVELAGAFIAGVRSQGVDVVDLGLASTDMGYFAAGNLDSPCAIFTASHNPAKYNGIKFCLAGASPIGVETGLEEIKRIANGILGPNYSRSGQRKSSSPTTIGSSESVIGSGPRVLQGSLVSMDILDAYANHVRSFVNLDYITNMKVIADTANGMGGLVVPNVFKPLGIDLEILYPELDGNFPNHPADPIQPENLHDLIELVISRKADVGLAFDGDADRVFLVDEKGIAVPGSTTTAMVAAAMLDKYPGAIVLYNLICSKSVPEVIKERGGTAIRTKVGHSFIKAVMAESGAIFGGEHSGHYYFRDNYRADSGMIAAMIILEMMGKASQPLSELRKPFERYVASGEINTQVADTKAAIEQVERYFARQYPSANLDYLDGLTVDLGDWWFNLRPSNTEPLLRLNVEAPDQESLQTHVDSVLEIFSSSTPKKPTIFTRKKND